MTVAILQIRAVDEDILESVSRRQVRVHPSDRGAWVMQNGDALIDLIAALFNVDGRDLRRPGGSGLMIGEVRQVAMYVAHIVLQFSMTEVGMVFGRDRTTVTHACHKIEDMRDDPDVDRLLDRIERQIAKELRPFDNPYAD